MSRRLKFDAYKPQEFCKFDCPRMDLRIETGRVFGNGERITDNG